MVPETQSPGDPASWEEGSRTVVTTHMPLTPQQDAHSFYPLDWRHLGQGSTWLSASN